MMKLRACLLAAALAAATSPALAQTTPIDRIAAVVNEDVILQSELDRAIANITAQYAGNPTQLPPREVLARQVLERLVLTRLQVNRAQESGIRINDQEVDQAIAGIARQNNLSREQLAAQLARDDMSMDDFRRNIRDEITIQRLKQSFAQSRVNVSEAEVNAALAQAQGAAGGTQYRLAHILVALPEGATPEQIATGQKKIDGIKGLIDRNEIDFAAAAVRYSDSPNALEGGDLGWRPESEIPPAFAQNIKGMQTGQVLGPIRGASGFQLIRLVETRHGAEAGPAMSSQYHLRHIVVATDDKTHDAAARAKLESLRARVSGGADFAKLAREESQDPGSREQGGELGWVNSGDLGPLAEQLTTMKDGEVTAPMQIPGGWHIIQRVGQRQAEVGGDQQRATVRENIGRRKLEDEYGRFLQEMRGDAFVDVRSESVIGVKPAEDQSGG
ncbi:molecular chaperone SurA [Lysobacter pythonis]|uniref:Chaperone SurA n=1 Tax=Solilutibacter pythonis TaxID=2483112 RepID=A0A3M2HR70_9GAMM|nr:peptidylprolyl isomerase [Lysobacter pythonis]RMH88687.1 molecular chaperone SurA [Lysobacter pythonis]